MTKRLSPEFKAQRAIKFLIAHADHIAELADCIVPTHEKQGLDGLHNLVDLITQDSAMLHIDLEVFSESLPALIQANHPAALLPKPKVSREVAVVAVASLERVAKIAHSLLGLLSDQQDLAAVVQAIYSDAATTANAMGHALGLEAACE